MFVEFVFHAFDRPLNIFSVVGERVASSLAKFLEN